MDKVTKKSKPQRTAQPVAPDHLTMRLFAPGMSPLHRAGLGGLACTLKAIERQLGSGLLSKNKLPRPFDDDKPPWDITPDTLTLRFGKPGAAGAFLEKLFNFAFKIRNDGLIALPGQYATEPSVAVLADLQAGLTLTFLQHGKVRNLAKEPKQVSYDANGDGAPGVVVEYKPCSWFKHQDGWKEFVNEDGSLASSPIKVDGPISPGTVVRHVAFTGDTGAKDPPERMLPLYFALVGCLSLRVNRGVAALLAPEVTDLSEFADERPLMTPTIATECQIANAADGVFSAQCRIRSSRRRDAEVRSRARKTVEASAIPGCYAMTFTPTPWASQQKSRVATIHVPPDDDGLLDRYERAASHLPSKVVSRTVQETSGRGKKRTTIERRESFRTDSIVRPLVAENLALGRKWYSGFVRLVTKVNPATNSPYYSQLRFERGGLHNMISDDAMWDSAGERSIVQAVHEALRGRYKQIAKENEQNPAAMKNRFNGEYDRWRLAFAGSKTVDQFRNAICDLFSRARRNSVLQTQWQDVLPLLRAKNWQHARDLALLALCSYQGRESTEHDDKQTETN